MNSFQATNRCFCLLSGVVRKRSQHFRIKSFPSLHLYRSLFGSFSSTHRKSLGQKMAQFCSSPSTVIVYSRVIFVVSHSGQTILSFYSLCNMLWPWKWCFYNRPRILFNDLFWKCKKRCSGLWNGYGGEVDANLCRCTDCW